MNSLRNALPIILVLVLVFGVASVSNPQHQSQTQTYSLPINLADNSISNIVYPFYFYKFDTSLGTLTYVYITVESKLHRLQHSEMNFTCVDGCDNKTIEITNYLYPTASFSWATSSAGSNYLIPFPNELGGTEYPLLGFKKTCKGKISSCSKEISSPDIISSYSFPAISSPGVLDLFKGSGLLDAVDIEFVVNELSHSSPGMYILHQWCPWPMQCYDPIHFAGPTGYANGAWTATVTLHYYYAPATAYNFYCPPTAEVNGPYAGYVGFPITFSALGSYGTSMIGIPGGESCAVLNLQWAFGDGTSGASGSSLTIDHVYDAPYSGTVNLFVCNAHGDCSTDTAPVTVSPPIQGDLDGDCDVDNADVAYFQSILGSQTGDPAFNPRADFDGDGRITINDLRILRSLITGPGICGN